MSSRYLKKLVTINGMIPAFILAWDAWRGQLGANSVNNAIHITGLTSLVFLFLSLAITPLRQLTGWSDLVTMRRMLGLYGFFYALLHFLIYVLWDRMGSLSSTLEEMTTRRFLIVGAIAIILMFPLAITSTNGMIKRLGASRWRRLHQLAYLVAILGVVHFYMLVKSDIRQPVLFAAILTPLLGFRLFKRFFSARPQTQTASITPLTAPTLPSYFKGELLVANIHQENPRVKTFRFVNPHGGDLPFRHKPGQYLNLELPIGGKIVRRSYTIASSSHQRRYVELTIKRENEGRASQYMHDHIHVGSRLNIGAPGGKFFFDPSSNLDPPGVVLIAGGVGITPVMSMLRSLCDQVWSGNIYFVNVVQKELDLIFERELTEIVTRFENVKLLQFVTQRELDFDVEENQLRWLRYKGRPAPAELLEQIADLNDCPVYMCGPTSMMDSIREGLVALGIDNQQIHTEEFSSPDPAGSLESTDDASTQQSVASQVKLLKSNQHFHVKPDQTILEAAEDARIELPWECRSGICGTCKVLCLEGRVKMAIRDALSTQDGAQGYILACQAQPVDQHIILDA